MSTARRIKTAIKHCFLELPCALHEKSTGQFALADACPHQAEEIEHFTCAGTVLQREVTLLHLCRGEMFNQSETALVKKFLNLCLGEVKVQRFRGVQRLHGTARTDGPKPTFELILRQHVVESHDTTRL